MRFLILLFVLTSCNIFSQDTLKIGVKESAPFVFKYNDGQWGGLCIDIVENLSKNNNFKYKLININGTYDEAINLVSNDSLDMLALDVSISPNRLEKVDFTQPFFITSTGIATKTKEKTFIDRIFSVEFIKSILIGLLVLVFIAVIFWILERNENDKISTSNSGILDSIYFVVIILSTVGFGDITPVSKWGKRFTSLVIAFSLFFMALLTGTISSSFVLDELEVEVTSMNELNKMKTGTITGTFSEKLLKDNNIKTINYDSPENAFDAINDGELDAFVYDKAILDYLSNQDKYSDIVVSSNTFKEQRYGFVLKKDDTLTNKLNPTLIKLINDERWETMLSQYNID